MKLPEKAVIYIQQAEYAEDYKIRLTFSDESKRTVDFGPFLNRSQNPLIRKYLDSRQFSAFIVRDGDLIWGDYDLCFPIADLYEGHI